MIKLIAVAGLALAIAAPAAHAFTIDLTVGGADAPSRVFTAGGVSVTATAGQFSTSSPVFTAGGDLEFDSSLGLGVDSGTRGDQDDVDGFNGNDGVLFSFDQVVELVSITFTNVDSSDEFRFFARGNDGQGAFVSPGEEQIPLAGVYTFAQDWVGTLFGVAAFDNNDDFRIAALEVNVVPLPAAAWLLLAGVAGFAIVGRTRRAA